MHTLTRLCLGLNPLDLELQQSIFVKAVADNILDNVYISTPDDRGKNLLVL